MTTHTGRVFLNSCLKVPIDPCNNCPAPIYNRPKMYLGRLTTTTPTPMSLTMKQTATTSQKTSELDGDTIWTSTTGIRSLAKLYDSIPEYNDINHLPNEEFYSTLDTLRSTCCQLKTKPLNKCGVLEACSTTSSSLSSHYTISIGDKSKKSTTKKKSAGGTKKCGGSSKKKSNHHKTMHEHNQESRCITETPSYSVDYKIDLVKRTKLRSFKEEFEDEVEAFKKTLQDYEKEFKQRPVSSNTYRAKTMGFNASESKQKVNEKLTNNGITKEVSEKMPTKPASSCFREYLKKSFSFNDIHSISDSNDADKDKHLRGLSKAETSIYKDRHKLSNYVMQKSRKAESSKTPPDGDLPKIIIESPSSENVSSKSSRSGRRKKSKCKSQNDTFKLPFTLFELNSFKKENDLSTASPVYPVARPNLAATLRAEVSKKKLQELQNNCTYYDTTPQVDWEVRKTPAWKTLSLNESHKQILLLRLATRKAEQALQKREYDLNMELMRQRVKTAPLLLEGTTFWGPNVGKVTHTCQREGIKHTCHSNQRRQYRKKSAGTSCSNDDSRAMEEGGGVCECAVSRMSSNKRHTLRKIYSSNAKSHSRISHHSGTGRKEKQHNVQDDDDLSSLDRAYL